MTNPTRSRRAPRAPGLVTASLVFVAFVGLIAANYGLALLRDVRATLPPTPDLETIAVSTEVVDRDGKLLRPFSEKVAEPTFTAGGHLQ